MTEQFERGEWPLEDLPTSWTWLSLDELWTDWTDSKKKLPRKNYLDKGLFPVIDQGEALVGGYSSDESLLSPASPPCVVWGDHTRCIRPVVKVA